MKIDYQITLDKAKAQSLIKEGDKFLFCTLNPKEVGRSGSFVETYYHPYDILFVVNKNEVRLIDVDQKTGELVGIHRVIERADIRNFAASWFFGWGIFIRTYNSDDYDNFTLFKKFGKLDQSAMLKEMIEFIKQEYTLPIKEAKKNNRKQK